MKTDLLDLRNMDCMDLMREFPDKHFDLAIVDPPYGISAPRMNMGEGYSDGKYRNRLAVGGGAGKYKRLVEKMNGSDWDQFPPKEEYFVELRRVSKDRIIWGGNYFPLPPTRCVICWDKEQPWENFSQWEMAWTSFDKPAKLFRCSNGGTQPGKIHPTQKPVALYSWLLSKFAGPGFRILDTHLGSGSIAIACHYYGANLTASEIDADYYKAACERITERTRQTTLAI
jgi:site-specific DNA-methyltransferase (adenine-specific)